LVGCSLPPTFSIPKIVGFVKNLVPDLLSVDFGATIVSRAIHHKLRRNVEFSSVLASLGSKPPDFSPIIRCPVQAQIRLKQFSEGDSPIPFNKGTMAMSSIPAPVRQVLAAQDQATNLKIDTAVLRKSLDSQQQTGDAINQLLQQAANLQKQLASGHIDVKV
jgi:hypothetical protein